MARMPSNFVSYAINSYGKNTPPFLVFADLAKIGCAHVCVMEHPMDVRADDSDVMRIVCSAFPQGK